jgi:hypothetical protein
MSADVFALNMESQTITKDLDIICSSGPTDEEKEISQRLSDYINEHEKEWLKQRGLIRMNFDVKKHVFGFYVVGLNWVHENGSVRIIPIKYKLPIRGNIYSTTISFFERVGTLMALLLPQSVTESFAMAKDQIKNDMVTDAKKIGAFSFICSAFTSVFGLPFWLILLGLFCVSVFEFLLSLIKRFRLPGVDYSPLAKLQVFSGSLIIFTAFSFAQIVAQYAIYEVQGVTIEELFKDSPVYLQTAVEIINMQTIGMFFIIGFYINTMKKMFLHGSGSSETLNPPI